MDTLGLLGQAIECSVCLEQLDSTSRVLPCQHTFCRKCLVDIINTRKELRCPECRVLVTVPFNSLPPNILLLRILEGMKNIPNNISSSSDQSDLSNLSYSQSQQTSDPFSIFSQAIDPSCSTVQTSNVPVRNNEASQGGSKNPFLQPNLNLYTNNVDTERSVTTTQNVFDSIDGRDHSTVSDINSQSNDILSKTVNSFNLNITNQQGNGSENIFSQPSSNRNSAISIANTLSSPISQAQFRSDISLGVNNRDAESFHTQTTMLSTLQPSILPSELNNLSNMTPNLSRMSSSNVLLEPSTSGSSNDRGNESHVSESTEVVNVSKWEESSLLNIRSNIVRQLSTKSLRESQLSGVSCQPYISPLNLQALALYNYNGKEARDLRFKKGDTMTITKQIDENWYQGELNGQVGIVPSSYIKFTDPHSSHIPQCKALYDFKMVSEEERNCLMFCKGDIITILRRIDENWVEGKLNTHIGIFPFSFVELNEAAKKLLRLSESASSSAVTPVTTGPNSSVSNLSSSLLTVSSNASTPICSILSPVPVHATSPQQPVQTNISDSTQLTNQNSLTNFQSCPSLPSWASQSTNRLSGVVTSTNISASPSKSPTASERSKSTSVARPHSSSDVDGRGGSITLATLENLKLYIAMYSYRPRKADELELKKGFLYSVSDKCQDGWFKGRCLSTDKIGVFPGNYVQLADAQTISSALSPRYSSMNIASYFRGSNKSKASSSPAKSQSQTGSLGDVRNLNNSVACPPELPPRSITSSAKSSSSLSHNQNQTLERPSSASEISTRASSCSSPISHQGDKKSNSKDRYVANGGGISLIEYLRGSGKRNTKSPPSLTLDNPVFDDSNVNRTRNSVPFEDEMKSTDTILKSSKQPVPLVKERYICIVPYPANSTYELELQLGDVVYVYKKRDDGWFKGTHQKTGKTGLFPSIFVQSY